MSQEEVPKILQKFQKLKNRHKPLYTKAFGLMNALTEVLQVSDTHAILIFLTRSPNALNHQLQLTLPVCATCVKLRARSPTRKSLPTVSQH